MSVAAFPCEYKRFAGARPHSLPPCGGGPGRGVARRLRKDATAAERRLWQGIRREQIGGFRFRRQVILAGFIADFACHEARLVVEVDGATHSSDAEVMRDAARTAALCAQGYDVVRFTNDEVFGNLDGVLETIRLRLVELRPRMVGEPFGSGATPLPDPPPRGGREGA